MARTWPVTRRKKAALRVFDLVAKPISSVFFRDPQRDSDAVRKILVVELWHMGDVVLATAAMQQLKQLYPDAKITLLGEAARGRAARGKQLRR